jgi:hypothetical protein
MSKTNTFTTFHGFLIIEPSLFYFLLFPRRREAQIGRFCGNPPLLTSFFSRAATPFMLVCLNQLCESYSSTGALLIDEPVDRLVAESIPHFLGGATL